MIRNDDRSPDDGPSKPGESQHSAQSWAAHINDVDSFVDFLPDGLLAVDREGRIVSINEHALKMFGYDRGEVLGQSLEVLVPERLRGEHVQHRSEYLLTPKLRPMGVGLELVARRKDGTEFFVEVSLGPKGTTNDSLVLAIVRDVSERKQQERQLRSRQEQQAAIAELSLIGLTSDLDLMVQRIPEVVSRVLDVEYCKILELLPDGKAFLLRSGVGWREGTVGHATLLAEDNSQAGYTLLQSGPVIVEDLATEKRFSAPPLLRDHGVASGMSVVIPASGRPYGVLGVHTKRRRDFSAQDTEFIQTIAKILGTVFERHRAEKVHDRLVSVLEAAPDLIGIADADGKPIYLNQSGRRMWGLGDDDAVEDIEVGEFRSPGERERFLNEILPAATRDGVWRGETTFIRHGGTEVPVSQVIVAHKTPAGEVEFLSTIARDITERKQLEQQVVQLQKMEAVGRLASGIAHDFNNMLTVIFGHCSLSLDVAGPGSSEALHMEAIKKAAESAAGLTRQLLAFSRKQLLRPRILNLNRAILTLKKMLERVIDENIQLVTLLDPGIGSVKAGPAQIEQVIMNLAINARDAMPGGGVLTVETTAALLDESDARATPGSNRDLTLWSRLPTQGTA